MTAGGEYDGARVTGAEYSTCVEARGGGAGLGFAAGAGGLYGSGGGASGVVGVGDVDAGGPSVARAIEQQQSAAAAMRIATAGARTVDTGMAASPAPTARAAPAVASCDADDRVDSLPGPVLRVRAAPRAPSSRRSNDPLPWDPRFTWRPLPGVDRYFNGSYCGVI